MALHGCGFSRARVFSSELLKDKRFLERERERRGDGMGIRGRASAASCFSDHSFSAFRDFCCCWFGLARLAVESYGFSGLDLKTGRCFPTRLKL